MNFLSLIFISGYIALFLILWNIALYFLFLTIRKGKKRSFLIKVAKISRIWMKSHRPIGGIAALFIIWHGYTALSNYGLYYTSKSITGILASSVFVLLFISGVLRHNKANGSRRKIHKYMAFTFLFFVLLHLVLPKFL
ncbi:hypothetical protein QA612_17065 [Evansella sp. AB-P1]|uniref:hypothetical protein n=1 Tax=Evansella sp. AB-P1 TaxID=3037653 RepID=UPI00241E93F6|nr:hypothetical protein [Evansella sp. AB-P1]MDG5789171.1 hypothetical protein [Evansella sp. AB-P1]